MLFRANFFFSVLRDRLLDIKKHAESNSRIDQLACYGIGKL